MKENIDVLQSEITEIAERTISSLSLEKIRLSKRRMEQFLKGIGLTRGNCRKVISNWKQALQNAGTC